MPRCCLHVRFRLSCALCYVRVSLSHAYAVSACFGVVEGTCWHWCSWWVCCAAVFWASRKGRYFIKLNRWLSGRRACCASPRCRMVCKANSAFPVQLKCRRRGLTDRSRRKSPFPTTALCLCMASGLPATARYRSFGKIAHRGVGNAASSQTSN